VLHCPIHQICKNCRHLGAAALIQPLEVLAEGVAPWLSFETITSLNPGQTVSKTWLEESFANFTASDDVFHPIFLEGLVIQNANKSQDTRIDYEASAILQYWGVKWTHIWPADSPTLPLGPYLVNNRKLFQVWRLYSDDKLAFLQSVWPTIGSPR
jgi:hypothetical protein